MKIVSIPRINGLNKTKGCEKTPFEVIKALEGIYSNESGNFIEPNLLYVENVNIKNNDISKDERLIYEHAKKYFNSGHKLFFLGGDHSISFPLVKGFLENCKRKQVEPCLIIFDAHPDLMEPMKEPTHEEWLRALIEEGFPVQNILLVGVRNSYKSEIAFIKKNRIRIIDCNSLLLDIEDICDTIMEFSSGKELYVSIDIDVVDPAFAPATGYKEESGGLTGREIIYLVSRLAKVKGLRAVDLVEINSVEDKKYNNKTVKLGAKILGEFL